MAAIAASVTIILSMGAHLNAPSTPTGAQGLSLSNLPLSFEPNAGQAPDPNVRFLTHISGGAFYFGESQVVLTIAAPLPDGEASLGYKGKGANLRGERLKAAAPDVMRLQFVGAKSNLRVTGGEILPGTVSYFRGNDPANWDTGLPTYAGITYQGLYPGIDLQYDGTRRQLKGTYIVAPGSDPTQIRWRYDGVGKVEIDDTGNIQITLNDLKLTEGAPVAWQEVGGQRRQVQVRYVVAADGSIGFVLGAYDPSQPLVIDPTLTYSSYLGYSFDDEVYDIAVDGAGNIYVTGANQSTPNALGDLSVYKINADASAILYTAYLVGNDSDVSYGIAVDAGGSAYITGESFSTDFPLVSPFQSQNCAAPKASDAVVVKLNPAGSGIVYSTYLGGCGSDTGRGIAVDANGSAYVTGDTGSTPFPIQNAFQSFRAGPRDAFVTKFTPSGEALVYSTYLGGGALNDLAEYGWAIKVDSVGSAYVAGYTGETDFPLQSPIQPNNAGFGDSFLTKFAPSGTALVYSTYLGGGLNDIASDVAIDSSGNAYVVGWTESTNFPTFNAYQATNHGYEDVFVTRANAAGNAWTYSTYLGGMGRDGQYKVSLEVTTDGSMSVTGDTQSSDFPVGNWIQQFHANPTYPDIFVTRISPSGAALLYSTFLGGNVPDNFTGYPIDVAYGLATDANGNAYIAGQTNSPNWPIEGNPFQPNYGGGPYDGLVAKIDPNPQGPPVPPAPTPGACATTDYVITQSSGVQIVPGTTDTGNHCDFIGCTTGINLPFPFTLYDRTFTSAYLGSAGTIGFVGNQGYAISRCLPLDEPQNLNFGILAYWDYVETDGSGCPGGPCGIYTSVSGSAPNRIFNIEWRAKKYRSFQQYDPISFEVRLYENSPNFEVIYGEVSNSGADATFGVQRDTGSRFTQYACHTAGSVAQGLKLSYTLPTCVGPQPTMTVPATATHVSSTPSKTSTNGAQTPTRTSTPQTTGTASTSVPASTTRTATPSPTCSGTWVRVNSPSPNEIRSYLYDVEVIAPNNIWAVGSYNTNFGLDDTLILHWDGTAWAQVTGPNVLYSGLFSVSAIAPNDIWAVGYYNPDEFHPYQPLAIHWDGTSWSQVPTPGNPAFETTLQGVDAVSTNDVWAVGENEDGQLIMHWNGSTWSIVPHPLQHGDRTPASWSNPEAGRPDIYFDSLYAVAAVSANDVWAVGTQGDHSLALHWNGTQWATVGTPNPYSTVILSGLTIISANDIWAVGSSDFYMGQPRALTVHWNGQAWSNVPTPSGDLILTDVAAFSSTDIWAVGYEQIDQYHTGEVLLHRQGGSPWLRVPGPNPPSPTLNELYGVAVSSPTEAWAVGLFDGATLVDRYTNSCSTPIPSATVTSTPQSTGTTTATFTPGSATSTATVCPITFTDVPVGSTFYEFIRCLACRGIVNGYPDGTFKPNANVTRGQLSKIVANSAGFSDPQTVRMFQDVPAGAAFFEYIGRLATRGYVGGYPCSGPGEPCEPGSLPYFRPNNNATRGQISKIVSNAAGFTEPHSERSFEDVLPGSTFYDFVERLASRGVMSGYECGGAGEPCVPPANRPYFRPNNNATRGQTAKIPANTFFPNCQTPYNR
jgi:hypothetical protein